MLGGRMPALTLCYIGALFVTLGPAVNAATFRFDTDPFAGSNALKTTGRQIVGGEAFINFNIATDIFSLESTVFGTSDKVQFVNTVAANLPSSGVNIIVLESFDDDN